MQNHIRNVHHCGLRPHSSNLQSLNDELRFKLPFKQKRGVCSQTKDTRMPSKIERKKEKNITICLKFFQAG